jgi:hypothetical protein
MGHCGIIYTTEIADITIGFFSLFLESQFESTIVAGYHLSDEKLRQRKEGCLILYCL